MAAQVRARSVHIFLTTGRTAQVGWLLFALLALSLALPGIAPFYQLLLTACTGTECLIGQLTPDEVPVAAAFGDSLPEYAQTAYFIYLPTYGFLLLAAVFFIWRKPTNKAAVCGAFTLTALATSDLAQATAHIFPLLIWPMHLVQFVQIAGLLLFFCLMPDGRFHPVWLRWPVLALIPAIALVAFDLTGAVVSQTLSLLIGVILVGTLSHRYRSLPASPQQEQVVWTLAALFLLAAAQWMGRPVRPLPLPAIPLDAIPPTAFGFFPVLVSCLSWAH